MTKSINSKLDAYRALISNSRNEELGPMLATYGVDAAYLDEGEALYQETMRLMELQRKEYQEEREGFDLFFARKDGVEKNFQNTRDLARELSKNDPDLQDRLKFSPMSRLPMGDWIQAGIDFYDSLLRESAFLERLARFNVAVDRLNNEKQELEALRQLRARTLVEKGQAQEATRLRNQKLEELEDYCRLLKTLAGLALEHRPQLMESLGVLVRS